MPRHPILASLGKHRIPAMLVILEIALSCAVLCNAMFMISQRVNSMNVPNGIDEPNLVVLTLQGARDDQAADTLPRNLAALQAIDGVKNVAPISNMPLDGNPTLDGFTAKPAEQSLVNSSEYFIGSGAPATLGLRLLQGRLFNAVEYANGGLTANGYESSSHVVLISPTDAQRLWPGQNPLGRLIYSGAHAWTVIGVVDGVLGMNPGMSGLGEATYSTMFFPLHADPSMSDYLLRVAPQDRERVMRQAERVLRQLEPGAVISGETYEQMRDDYFADVSSMAWMLVLVCMVMLAVTAFGIVGLTSFWVGQRRTQIGIRRALGATRGQIMQYFQTENFLLSSFGLLLGALLAYALNLYLMRHYETPLMPWYYLPVGMLALWLLGQLATLGPAIRASTIAPVAAIRPE